MRKLWLIFFVLALLSLLSLGVWADEADAIAQPEAELLKIDVDVDRTEEQELITVTEYYSDGSVSTCTTGSIRGPEKSTGELQYIILSNATHTTEQPYVVKFNIRTKQEAEPETHVLSRVWNCAEDPAEPEPQTVEGFWVAEPEEDIPEAVEKTLTWYSEDDRPLWSIELDAAFAGGLCHDASSTVTALDPAWAYEDPVCFGLGTAEAGACCVMTRRVLGVEVARLEVTLVFDDSGACSATVRNVTAHPRD